MHVVSYETSQKTINHQVPCGRGAGDSIQVQLLSLMNQAQPTSDTNPPSMPTSIGNSPMSTSNGKRYFLRSPRTSNDQYTGPYGGPKFFKYVKRKFITDWDVHEVTDNQRVSFLHEMFGDDSLRYFNDHGVGNAYSIEDAFQRIHRIS